MKNMIKLPAILLGLLLLLTGITQKAMAQDDDISLETFYDELSPYGTWIEDPSYGYVWRPDVDRNDFRPYYTNGRWAMTEYGNTWVSDYDWGWAPFHYGRWVLNDFNDWIWIPDTIWGPAWVSWRTGGGYYGWAPLGPGIDIDVNIGGGFDIPFAWWVFIPQRTIYSNYYPRYYGRNQSIFNRTAYINYTYRRDRHTYYTGPRADDIRRVTNRNVTVYNVSRSNRPGRTSISNNNLNIYSPRGGRSGNNSNGGRPDQPNRNNAGNVRPGQPGRGNPVRGNDQGQRPDQPGRNNTVRGNDQGQRPDQPGRNNTVRGNDQGQRPDQPGRNNTVRGNDQGQRPDQPGRNNTVRGNDQGQRPDQPGRNNTVRGNDQGQRPDRTAQPQRDDQQVQEQIRQQRDQQRQQREGQQRQQQRQQQEQQKQQQDQQRQQQDQQRQQQQRQQQEQQKQQQDQQRQQQQRQQQEQQKQQQDQQRQQQQRQQQDQQRQQQDQQRQQRESQQRSTEGQSSRTGRGTRG